MTIITIPSGPFETNSYIYYCPTTLQAAIVDAPPDSTEPIKRTINKLGLKPVMLLLTHSHWDHTAEAKALSEAFNIPAYIHPLDAGNLESPGSDGLPLWIDIPPKKPDVLIKEGDIINVGDLKLQVIETPGHTPGGVCFYDAKNNILLSGDTLFKGTIGNLSFPTARIEAMWQSLKKLASLPGNTAVYPGHGPSTTIASEPWLSKAKDIFG